MNPAAGTARSNTSQYDTGYATNISAHSATNGTTDVANPNRLRRRSDCAYSSRFVRGAASGESNTMLTTRPLSTIRRKGRGVRTAGLDNSSGCAPIEVVTVARPDVPARA